MECAGAEGACAYEEEGRHGEPAEKQTRELRAQEGGGEGVCGTVSEARNVLGVGMRGVACFMFGAK